MRGRFVLTALLLALAVTGGLCLRDPAPFEGEDRTTPPATPVPDTPSEATPSTTTPPTSTSTPSTTTPSTTTPSTTTPSTTTTSETTPFTTTASPPKPIDRECTIKLPFLPWALDLAGIALSLGNVEIHGLNDNDFILFSRTLTWHHVQLVSDPYVAKGWLYSLPIAGRGRLTVDIEELKIQLKISGAVVVTMDDFRVNFEGLNPGQDSGDLVNAFLGTLTDDIAALLTEMINGLLAPEARARQARGIFERIPDTIPLCVENEQEAPEEQKSIEELSVLLKEIDFQPMKFLNDFLETAVQRISQGHRRNRI